jgi:hypothetical protein
MIPIPLNRVGFFSRFPTLFQSWRGATSTEGQGNLALLQRVYPRDRLLAGAN